MCFALAETLARPESRVQQGNDDMTAGGCMGGDWVSAHSMAVHSSKEPDTNT